MGTVSAYSIMTDIVALTTKAAPNDVAIDLGWKLLLFGAMQGFTGYFSGQAISINKETILKLVSFTPVVDQEVETSSV